MADSLPLPARALRPRRYLARCGAAALAAWLAIAAWNATVDPYDVFGLAALPGFNDAKSPNLRLEPLLDYLERQPAVVFFGSSRIAAFRQPLRQRFQRRAMTYTLPALKIAELAPLLPFLESRARPERIVIGFDFFAFNAADTLPPPTYARLDGLFWVDFVFRNLLSWDVMREGVLVVAASLTAPPAGGGAGGGPGPDDAAVAESYRRVVGFYLDRSYYGGFRFDAAAAAALEQALAGLAERGVAVQLFISPPHLALLATLRLGGYWPAFEDYQRRMLALAEAEGFELWDFSGVTEMSGERIGADMQWYADPSHYRPRYAALMLARLEGEAPDPAVGVRLAPAMLEAHLAAKRAAVDGYLAAHPDLVRLVQEGAARAGVRLPDRP